MKTITNYLLLFHQVEINRHHPLRPFRMVISVIPMEQHLLIIDDTYTLLFELCPLLLLLVGTHPAPQV